MFCKQYDEQYGYNCIAINEFSNLISIVLNQNKTKLFIYSAHSRIIILDLNHKTFDEITNDQHNFNEKTTPL